MGNADNSTGCAGYRGENGEMNIYNKWMTVQMDDGIWAVPVKIIADDRAHYYAEKDEEFGGSFERSLNEDTLTVFQNDDFEILDWAACNMNWEDVAPHAVKLTSRVPDYDEGWANGDREIIDELPGKGEEND